MHLARRFASGCSTVRHPAACTLMRSRRAVTTAPTGAAAVAPQGVLCTSHRTYYWPYPDNFIPEGATTSSFQSSPVPSVRERIVREYALSPLFGRRTPCCVLGFAESAATLVDVKGELRRCVAQALGKSEADVELGPLQQIKEMMLHRSGTSESPRLADGPCSGPEAEGRRTSRYARRPVAARTLVEVYLPGEEEADYGGASDEDDNTEAAVLAHGWFLQEQLCRYVSARNAVDDGGASAQAKETGEKEDEDGDDVKASIAYLHDELGVVYCEVPALDESGFLFDELHGQEVDGDTAARVVDRWTRRMAQQQQQQQQQPKP